MELPDDVVAIIRDYSRPITRPNWRTIHHMTGLDYYTFLAKSFNKTKNKLYWNTLRRDNKYMYMFSFYNDIIHIDCVYGPVPNSTVIWFEK